MKSIIWTLSFIVVAVSSFGQNYLDCKEYIKQHKRQVSFDDRPNKGYQHHMVYEVTNYPAQGVDAPITRVNLDLTLSNDKVVYYSKYMDFYMDREWMVTVNHITKEIRYSPSIEESWSSMNRGQKMGAVLDSLLNMSLVVSCGTNAAGEKSIQLSLTPEDAQKTGVSFYGYVFDSKTDLIKSGWIKYNPGRKMQRMEFKYHTLAFNLKDNLKPIEKYVSSASKPGGRYSGYRVIKTNT